MQLHHASPKNWIGTSKLTHAARAARIWVNYFAILYKKMKFIQISGFIDDVINSKTINFLTLLQGRSQQFSDGILRNVEKFKLD